MTHVTNADMVLCRKNALKKGFPQVKVRTLDSLFMLNDHSTFKTSLAVQKLLREPDAGKLDFILKKSVKKPDKDLKNAFSSAVGEEREVLEELLAAISVDQAKMDASNRLDQGQKLVQDEQDNFVLAKATGSASECGCCFEEFASNRMVYCNSLEPHVCSPFGCEPSQSYTRVPCLHVCAHSSFVGDASHLRRKG